MATSSKISIQAIVDVSIIGISGLGYDNRQEPCLLDDFSDPRSKPVFFGYATIIAEYCKPGFELNAKLDGLTSRGRGRRQIATDGDMLWVLGWFPGAHRPKPRSGGESKLRGQTRRRVRSAIREFTETAF